MFRARKSKRGVTRFLARFLLVNAVALSFVIVLSGRTFRGDGERTRLGHGLGDADVARPALRSASIGRLVGTQRHGRSVEDTRGRLFGTHQDTRMACPSTRATIAVRRFFRRTASSRAFPSRCTHRHGRSMEDTRMACLSTRATIAVRRFFRRMASSRAFPSRCFSTRGEAPRWKACGACRTRTRCGRFVTRRRFAT